ncbi:heme ABC transporter ATP-binding protein [Chthonobacter albigriseus]|uniref:heme ABC transporter ATP-binding protein n=1 Tax=Chthonobacter albigriseus TaxID=1683161 RepID=UPI0015EF646E|nr:heme ABC transporter ATP-binding protein [Chthonobacter albigriseus]
MIEAHDLSYRRGAQRVIDGVSAAVEAGRVTVAIGPNGAGKSTLLKLLSGEIRADSGAIRFGDRTLGTLSPADLARRRAVLPQKAALAFPFTVHEIVRLGAVAGGSRDPDRIAADMLEAVGLGGFGGRLIMHLSGGEQQRVQFARALAQVPVPADRGEPRALFLDEPTSSLDLKHQIGLLTVARDFARRGGAVFIVLHDLNLAAEFADELLLLEGGRLFASGPPTAALFERVTREVYGLAGAACRLPAAGIPFVLPQARTTG